MMRVLVSMILILGMSLPHHARAQSKVGTTILQFLKIEPGARSAAMGNAGAALSSGIDCVFFNAGVIGVLQETEATFTHSAWFADINYNYAAVAIPLSGVGTVLASVTALSSGELDVRTVEQPLGTGERYSVADVALGLGYGRQISSRFAAGLQIRYATERIWNSSVRVITLDLGTTYRLTNDGLLLSFGLSNLGTRASFDGRDLAIQYDADPDTYGDNSALPADQSTGDFMVPLQMRLGLSYPRNLGSDSRIVVAADALHPNDNPESLNLGAEWSWRNAFALRGGYQSLFEGGSDLGLTLGFGLGTEISGSRCRLDYGWADHDRLGATHRFTIVLGF